MTATPAARLAAAAHQFRHRLTLADNEQREAIWEELRNASEAVEVEQAGPSNEQMADLRRIHPPPWKAIPEHIVTTHWAFDGDEVLERTCTCGERWTADDERCPDGDFVDEVLDADGDVVSLMGVERVGVEPVNAWTAHRRTGDTR